MSNEPLSRTEAADLAKAFQELAQGERTATALENQLSSMEAKIEALLAEAERQQQKPVEHDNRGEQNQDIQTQEQSKA